MKFDIVLFVSVMIKIILTDIKNGIMTVPLRTNMDGGRECTQYLFC